MQAGVNATGDGSMGAGTGMIALPLLSGGIAVSARGSRYGG
nr:MAG TPA: hypothetical protein [Caudoviricetes sp.]